MHLLGGALALAAATSSLLHPGQTRFEHGAYLELFGVAAAIDTWGSEWTGQCVVLFSDSKVAVRWINKGTAKSENACILLRAIATRAVAWGFELRCEFIPGVDNKVPDALSRGLCPPFVQDPLLLSTGRRKLRSARTITSEWQPVSSCPSP